MNRLYKRFFLIALSVFLIFTVFFYTQYISIDERIRNEVEKTTKYEANGILDEINVWININSTAIVDSANFIQKFAQNDDQIFEYMKDKCSNYECFNSLYFGTPGNKLISCNGWIPGDDFVLTERPWYVKAVATDQVVVTGAYQNASKDDMIITIAKSIYDENGDLLGVVGGDVSILWISKLIGNAGNEHSGFNFIIDENKEVIIEPYLSQSNSVGILLQTPELLNIYDKIVNEKEGFITTVIEDKKGYLFFESVESTNWYLAVFVPFEDAYLSTNDIKAWYFSSIVIWLVAFLFLFYILSKYIVRPLVRLENNVEEIDIENNYQYRLSASKLREFSMLRSKINNLLDKIEAYINEINKDKEELSGLNNELLALFKNSPEAIVLFDSIGKIRNVNIKFTEMFEYSRGEVIGRMLSNVFAKTQSDVNRLINILLSGEELVEESTRYKKDGSIVEVKIIGVPIINNNTIVGGYAIYTDITQKKKIDQEIIYMSYHDQLTGLYNRRFYVEELKRLDTSRNLPITILLIDVNGLKLANDAFGHEIGDKLLTKIGEVLRKSCRKDEIVSRLGGDEFVILMPHISEKEAEILLKRIKKNASLEKFEPIELSFSAGIATKTDSSQDINSIFKLAEDKMYKQKLFESRNMKGNIINTIVKTLNAKNDKEEEHSKRVGELSANIAEKMGYSDEKIKEIMSLGQIHDIGKVGIPESILNKNGKFTNEEREIMKKHSEIGYRILSEINEMSELADALLSHHERYDGNGYPKKLKGDEIPLYSRIISVADSYDAMTSERTYKDKMTKEEAIKELKTCAGKQFDPAIVKIFVEKVLN